MSQKITHQSIMPAKEEPYTRWEPMALSVPAFSKADPVEAKPPARAGTDTHQTNAVAEPDLSSSPSMLPRPSLPRQATSSRRDGSAPSKPGRKDTEVDDQKSISAWLQLALATVLVLSIVAATALFAYVSSQQNERADKSSRLLEQYQFMRKLSSGALLVQQGSTLGFKYLRDSQQQIRDFQREGEPNMLLTNINAIDKEVSFLLKNEMTISTLNRMAGVGVRSPLTELAQSMTDQAQKLPLSAIEQKSVRDLVQQCRELVKGLSSLLDPNESEIEDRLVQQRKNTLNLMEQINFLINGNPRKGEPVIVTPQLRTIAADLLKNLNDLNDRLPKAGTLSDMRNSSRIIDKELAMYANNGLRMQLPRKDSNWIQMAAFALLGLALIAAILLIVLYKRDRQRRAESVQKERERLERSNKAINQSIIRLMDDLNHLADGDLTVKATVSEDITGSIADSINVSIEEFRVLVERINEATGRVNKATEQARKTSGRLLEAADLQSSQIQQMGRAALDVARALNEASEDAKRSAAAAKNSLAVADKGSLAVRDTLTGMNDMRDQIQETAQRIKRLGERSLEIGEIVEIIDDITEQTHVLALNAAIQAATAGEAGKGFGIVAQEVQRLAERSAQATQQISSIVKSIQTDTSNAIAAMEHSTQSVVSGSERAISADQAIGELHHVAGTVAQSVDQISELTLRHSQSASMVIKQMQEVLRFANQTTADTKQTAESIEELTRVAVELKTSVAGFRVH